MAIAIDARALIPPEIPQKRTYEVFSPFEFQAPSGDYYGANVVTAGGPSCLEYSVIFDLRQSGAPSTSIPASANLLGYRNVLRTQAGLMFAASHANSGVYVVEAYEGTASGETAALNAAAAYVAAGYGTSDEIKKTSVSGGYNAVRVSASWIQKRLSDAKNLGLNPRHDIVVQLGCNSYPANLAFVNVNGLTRNYAGLNDLCPIGTDPTYYHQISSTIFNTMAGIKADNVGTYSNAKFITGVGIAQGLFGSSTPNLRSQKDLAMPIADLMRLYNAPRVVLEEVRQDTSRDGGYATQLYYYNPYPTYPYGTGTQDYPGAASLSGQLSASSAPIRVSLRFSEPMDSGWGSFVVRLRFSDNSTQNISGTWSSTVLSNDSWTGTISPSPFPDGQVTVEVRARKALCGSGLDTNNQELDLTGSGNSTTSTYQTSATFFVDTSNPSNPGVQNPNRQPLPGNGGGGGVVPSSTTVVSTAAATSGICKLVYTGPAATSTYTFTASPSAVAGPIAISTGSNYVTAVGCNGLQSTSSFTVVAQDYVISVCVDATAASGGVSCANTVVGPNLLSSLNATATLYMEGLGGNCNFFPELNCKAFTSSCGGCACGGSDPQRQCGVSMLGGSNTIMNSTSASSGLGVYAKLTVSDPVLGSASANAQVTGFTWPAFSTVKVYYALSYAGQKGPTTGGNGTVTVNAPISGLSIGFWDWLKGAVVAAYRRVIAALPNVGVISLSGSDVDFTGAPTIAFSSAIPAGLNVSTASFAIYRFDGADWSSAAVTSQYLHVDSSNVVTATGTITQSGVYGLFYAAVDTTAPTTDFAIQGASSSFGGTMFVSTYSFLVLTATDPVVNGFASTVATITYRFDPSSGTAFSVYSSSIPAPLGTHVFQYRSWDYAGNAEAIKTATFTVTAGTVFKETSDDVVNGNLLVGFLGSGAKAEVVARAQDALTLAVSSADKTAMLAVSNIGAVGVGVPAPAAQLDLGAGSPSLQLRSGNTVSTGTSVQMTFGYNGDAAMRHALRTYHSTATLGNEMDFYLWTPAAGSTATIATREVLALQAITAASGGAMHVMPVGFADADLVVSNGLSRGAGAMERARAMTPSSRRFKSDIRYLGEGDEDRALAETAALNHVRFRYKTRAKDGTLYDDPRQAERVGLIYEDAPESLREMNGTISANERLANLELALKAAMRQLAALQKRYDALKAEGRIP